MRSCLQFVHVILKKLVVYIHLPLSSGYLFTLYIYRWHGNYKRCYFATFLQCIYILSWNRFRLNIIIRLPFSVNSKYEHIKVYLFHCITYITTLSIALGGIHVNYIFTWRRPTNCLRTKYNSIGPVIRSIFTTQCHYHACTGFYYNALMLVPLHYLAFTHYRLSQVFQIACPTIMS